MSRVLVVGAGAIGGFLAARLAHAGHEVTVLARGAHLQAIRQHGLRLEALGGAAEPAARVHAVDDLADAAPAEAVIVALKAYQVAPLGDALAAAARHARIFVPIQNGVGWWYFQRHGGAHEGRVVRAVDPQGALASSLRAASTVPAFAYKSAQVIAPGVVRHIADASDHLAAGELDGVDSERLRWFGALLEQAGVAFKPVPVRNAMWHKLLGNVFANPLSALTRRVLGDVVHCAPTRALAVQLMQEVGSVARALGQPADWSPEARLARAEAMAAAKPSMLQDLEAGRPMELDAILGALVELADVGGVEVPVARTLLACLRLVEYRPGSAG